ncbi:MAG: GDSL-type esterase/lipase family protein [Solirubrobacteraceae bacterium]
MSGLDRSRLGVVTFGDSITNGGGELQWGIALQSWALWTARALGMPYSPYAQDGATVEDVLGRQIPAWSRLSASPDATYQLGCLYIGTNDLRTPGLNMARFQRQFAAALTFLETRCETLLVATVPLDMGRPNRPRAIVALNEVISRTAADHGALVMDLSMFGGRRVMMADHVHPTALGQVTIAELAVSILERNGFQVRVRPSELISYTTSWRGRLQGDWVYTYRHVKQSLKMALAALRQWSRRADAPRPGG